MKRIVSAAVAVLLCACASQQASKEPTTKAEQQRVTNLVYFDVANCGATPPAAPADVKNPEVLTGVLVAARPLVMECLVDPKNRGPDKNTQVVVDSTLVESGVEHKVTGTNLTDAGAACVKDVLQKWTNQLPQLNSKAAPPPAPAAPAAPPPVAKKGAKPAPPPPPPPPAPAAPATPAAPVTAHVEFQHVAGINPAVTLGVNEASDIAGTIRLALPTWCDCLADWKSAPPSSFKVTLRLDRPKPPPPEKGKKEEKKEPPPVPERVAPTDVKFDPTNDPAADKVAACLTGKIKALTFKTPAGDYINLPGLPLRLVNAAVDKPLNNATPDLQFTQFDLIRNQRAAQTAIAVGARIPAEASYNDAVQRYQDAVKKKKTPDVTVKELKDKCALLLKTDDGVIDAMKAQLQIEDATHTFAMEQKAKDPAWAEVEAASLEKVGAAQKDVASWEATRKADENACPKVKY